MSIFSKKIEDITKEDLEELITQEERESINLDYKQGINPTTDGKHDLIRHVVGMANTEGGFIIYGIEEDKKEGIPIKLDGIDSSIGNQKVDEWIENVITPHISPRVIIRLKTISLGEKIAVIIWIPKSSRKPHMSTYENDFRVYRRYNTQTLPSSESEMREMYFSSNKYEKIFEEFINKKNLINEDSDNFALTTNSKQILQNDEQKTPNDFPIILFASCPKFLEERINIASENIQSGITKNFQTVIEQQSINEFNPREQVLDSKSITFLIKNWRTQNVSKYFEVGRNGYVEEGQSVHLTGKNHDNLHLGRLVISFWSFLHCIKNLYQRVDYYDPFSIYLCIRNMNNLKLHGLLGLSEDGKPWSSIHDDMEDDLLSSRPGIVISYRVAQPMTPKNKNFSYYVDLNPTNLDEKKIFDTVKDFSTRVSNEFGLPVPYCYNHDGSFAKFHLQSYNQN